MLQTIIKYTVLFFSFQAYGFIENVGHGYVNCMACHVSPSGGGLLNEYGRSLSKELMSTWGWKNSEQPLFGAAQNTDWFKIGGDYRIIQTYFENSQVKQGRRFVMQQNIELGFNFSKIWILGSMGTHEGQFISERHYLLWDLADDVKLRVGKFRLNYGLYDPNHTRLTKQPLGFGPNSESYILEVSKFTDFDEIFISADLGRIDIPKSKNSEKSISINYAKYTSEKSKIGTNVLVGESDSTRRSLFGIYGIGEVFEHFILRSELNYQKSYAATEPNAGKDLLSSVVSFGYQANKGVLPYVVAEHLQQDLSDNSSQHSAVGIGLQWLPIPHVELQAEYKKQTNKSTPLSQSDIGWLLFHLYL